MLILLSYVLTIIHILITYVFIFITGSFFHHHIKHNVEIQICSINCNCFVEQVNYTFAGRTGNIIVISESNV